MRKKITLLLCIGLIMVVAMAGCSSTSKKPIYPAKKPAQVQKKTAVDMTASERRVMADRLSRLAESVPGVQKATVVVMDVSMTRNTASTTTGTTKSPMTGTTTKTGVGTTTKTTGTYGTSPTNKSTMGTKSGTVVMVGLTLNTATAGSASKATTTKNMVAKRIKASDKRIAQVLVTTDPGLIKRLNDVAAGIIEGKPIQSFDKDIRDLNKRLKQQKAVY
ncbi:MAG: YhcN/YlaJ family sporulation lipoprotein [Deltaproteobacteria bacterium]